MMTTGSGWALGTLVVLRARLAHGFEHLVPGHAGQLHIEQDHVGRDVGQSSQASSPLDASSTV
jgi:hypothetical protein